MLDVELQRVDGIAYREAAPDRDELAEPVLCVHGWPQSSYMWRNLLPAIAAEGRRAVALDMPGFGDSPADLPGTWDVQVETLERFRSVVGLERSVLAVHDTGGAVGLRWACDHPEAVAGLVITNTGFFPDYEWHELAAAMRTEGQGETLVASLSRDGFATLLGAAYDGGLDDEAVDEYWKAFATEANRRAMLDLYRSFDLDEFAPMQEQLAGIGVPVLVLWGELDDYLPRDYATRFAQLPGAQLVTLPARHFLFEDQPDRCAREVIAFLRRARRD